MHDGHGHIQHGADGEYGARAGSTAGSTRGRYAYDPSLSLAAPQGMDGMDGIGMPPELILKHCGMTVTLSPSAVDSDAGEGLPLTQRW